MKRLNGTDKAKVLGKLRKEGMENLLLESWLEDFPLDEYSTLYQMGKDNYVLTLPSVATIISFPDGYELTDEDMLHFFKNAAPTIIGPEKLVHQIARLFPEREAVDSKLYGMLLVHEDGHDEEVVRLETDQQITDLLHLYLEVPEFRSSFEEYTEEEFIDSSNEMIASGRITTGIYRDGKLVSAASFTRMQLENICTHPDYRNQGLGRRTIRGLLHLIPTQKDGKRLILSTGNPVAGKLYETLGFRFLANQSRTQFIKGE